jgi:hypothetical protein
VSFGKRKLNTLFPVFVRGCARFNWGHTCCSDRGDEFYSNFQCGVEVTQAGRVMCISRFPCNLRYPGAMAPNRVCLLPLELFPPILEHLSASDLHNLLLTSSLFHSAIFLHLQLLPDVADGFLAYLASEGSSAKLHFILYHLKSSTPLHQEWRDSAKLWRPDSWTCGSTPTVPPLSLIPLHLHTLSCRPIRPLASIRIQIQRISCSHHCRRAGISASSPCTPQLHILPPYSSRCYFCGVGHGHNRRGRGLI